MDLGGCGNNRNCNSLFCFFLILFFRPLLIYKRGQNIFNNQTSKSSFSLSKNLYSILIVSNISLTVSNTSSGLKLAQE